MDHGPPPGRGATLKRRKLRGRCTVRGRRMEPNPSFPHGRSAPIWPRLPPSLEQGRKDGSRSWSFALASCSLSLTSSSRPPPSPSPPLPLPKNGLQHPERELRGPPTPPLLRLHRRRLKGNPGMVLSPESCSPPRSSVTRRSSPVSHTASSTTGLSRRRARRLLYVLARQPTPLRC